MSARGRRWNHCFVCCSEDKVGKNRSKFVGPATFSRTSIFFKYLLNFGRSGNVSDRLLQDVLDLISFTESGGRNGGLLHVCGRCLKLCEKLTELHEQLEVVQMKIAEVVEEARSAMKISGTKEPLRKLEALVKSEGGEGGAEGKMFLEVVQGLQTWVLDNENNVKIPLVYLKRVNVMSPQRGAELKVTEHCGKKPVKQELTEENNFFLDFGIDDGMPELDMECDMKPCVLEAVIDGTSEKRRKTKTVKRRKGPEVSSEEKPSRKLKLSNAAAEVVANERNRGRRKKGKVSLKSLKPEPEITAAVKLHRELAREARLERKAKLKVKGKRMKKKEKRVTCELCQFTTTIPYAMDFHLRQHENPSEKNFECPDCMMGFTTKQCFERHLQRHGEFWKCDICDKFVAQIGMKQHLLEEHKDAEVIIHTCKFCDRSYGKLHSYILHAKKHAGVKIECPLCPVVGDVPIEYKAGTEISRHLSQVHEKTDFILRCSFPSCQATFFDDAALFQHKLRHEGFSAICEDCGKEFSSESGLSTHRKAFHSSEKYFKCKECGLRFQTFSHLQTHHSKEHMEALVCHLCVGKKYTSTFGYRNHMWVHHKIGDRLENVCEICSKSFTTTTRLRDHLTTHSDVMNFSCKECDYITRTLRNLKRHVDKKHTSKPPPEKKFQCSYCDKKFVERHHLADHTRTHTGERPFQCDFCGKSFNQSSALHTHKKKVHAGLLLPIVKQDSAESLHEDDLKQFV